MNFETLEALVCESMVTWRVQLQRQAEREARRAAERNARRLDAEDWEAARADEDDSRLFLTG